MGAVSLLASCLLSLTSLNGDDDPSTTAATAMTVQESSFGAGYNDGYRARAAQVAYGYDNPAVSYLRTDKDITYDEDPLKHRSSGHYSSLEASPTLAPLKESLPLIQDSLLFACYGCFYLLLHRTRCSCCDLSYICSHLWGCSFFFFSRTCGQQH